MKSHLSLIFLSIIFSNGFALPWEPEPRPNFPFWMSVHNSFVENTRTNNGSINVLFYGDSITDWWRTIGKEVYDEYYAPLGAANYGIGGDRTEHVLWRIQNGEVTEALDPKICVIKIGTNNINVDNSSDIAVGVATNVLELQSRLPNMKILLLGVLPRTNANVTNQTVEINKIISQLDNGDTVRFLDMGEHFYSEVDGFNTELYIADLVHLSLAGYKKWQEIMNPLFQELIGTS